MSYTRVIPRDLFNEGNLLKCYGRLYLELEKLKMEDCLVYDGSGPFQIEQNPHDGSLTVLNVRLVVRGRIVFLSRPLNSKRPYPLYAMLREDDEIEVFLDDGRLTYDMIRFLKDRE